VLTFDPQLPASIDTRSALVSSRQVHIFSGDEACANQAEDSAAPECYFGFVGWFGAGARPNHEHQPSTIAS
jgi:hypothetical protein